MRRKRSQSWLDPSRHSRECNYNLRHRRFSETFPRVIAMHSAAALLDAKLRRGQRPSSLDQNCISAWANGSNKLSLLRKHGLSRDKVCIEVGCGNLRVGRHAIQFLDADRYIGFDICPRILLEAKALAQASPYASKRPRLLVWTTANRRAVPPADFLFLFEVLMHVSPEMLRGFITEITSIVSCHAIVVLNILLSDASIKFGTMSWIHAESNFLENLRENGVEPSIASRRSISIRSIDGESYWATKTLFVCSL